ncbi:MAG: hypothetical protein AAFR35_08425 [Pseudomonadota bacterium]
MDAARAALDERILDAHAKGDRSALVGLYLDAAGTVIGAPAAGFFLTQAYVFALETGDPRTDAIRERLVSLGAEDQDTTTVQGSE